MKLSKQEKIVTVLAKYYPLPIASMHDIEKMDDWCETVAKEIDAIEPEPIDKHVELIEAFIDLMDDWTVVQNPMDRNYIDAWLKVRTLRKELDV